VAEYRAAAVKVYGAHADGFLAAFPVATDADVKAAAGRASVASGMGLGARSWAKAQATTGKAPAYLFLFSRTQPYVPGVIFADHDPATIGAYHTGDVPYWLDTQDSLNMFRKTRNWKGYDRDLAAKMSDIVIAFAQTGNPSTPAVKMVPYRVNGEQLVDFGDAITIVTLDSKALDFIADTPTVPTGPPRR
jgi:para-nitrobenzyl esterase